MKTKSETAKLLPDLLTLGGIPARAVRGLRLGQGDGKTLISHLIFNFPELLLVVLAVILLIGNYSGYRLTELRRFEPMGRE